MSAGWPSIAGPAIDTRATGQGLLDSRFIAGGDGVKQRISRSGRCRRKHQRKEPPGVRA